MIKDFYLADIDKMFQLFPTKDNLVKLLGILVMFLDFYIKKDFKLLSESRKEAYRLMINKAANKILNWLSMYRKFIVSGEEKLAGLENLLTRGIIKKIGDCSPIYQRDYLNIIVIFSYLKSEESYLFEVNGNAGVNDGVQNGSHIFRGIHVAGLPGGAVYEVMREIYDLHNGPDAVISGNKKVYLNNKDGGNINKLRMRVMDYIRMLETKSGYIFPLEVKVSGERLEVIARGANRRARSLKSKKSQEMTAFKKILFSSSRQ